MLGLPEFSQGPYAFNIVAGLAHPLTSAMKKVVVLACLMLGGCLSVDITHREAFADIVGKTLTIQRPSVISPGSVMKSVMFGGSLDLFILRERTDDYDQSVAKGWEKDSILIPAGSELRVERIERRNLIDAGVEILVFGVIRNPKSGKFEPFAHALTRGLGSTIGRAPWEDSSVPEVRGAQMEGIRDFKIGSATDEKKG